MLDLTVQDWITIRGTGTTAVVQTSDAWLDVPEFADAVFWLEVREVTNPGAGTVSVIYETSPTRDESLFQPMGSAPAAVVGGPTVTKVMLNASAFVPLARYVRWKLAGTQAGTWDLTFRIQATLGMGAVGAFSPLQLAGLKLWLRADQGVTVSGGKVTTWTDQSGNGNDFAQGTVANQPVLLASGIGGRPSIDFTGTTWLENTLTNLVAANSAYSVLAVAKNGNGALFTIRRGTTYSTSMFYLTNTYVHADGVNASANVTVFDTTPVTQSSTNAFKSAHVYKGGAVNPDIFLNGGQKTVTSLSTSQGTETGTTGLMVGSNSASQYWGGLISELIVCSGAISGPDRAKVEAYQLSQFGV